MKRYLPIIILFLLAYLEIVCFIKVADILGIAAALLLIIASSLLGFALLKRQGLRILQDIQHKIAQGDNIADEMLRSAALFFAAILFIVPGFLSDVVGLLLLLPIVPSKLVLKLFPYFSLKFYQATTPPNSNIFEGEYQRHDDQPSTRDDRQLPKK